MQIKLITETLIIEDAAIENVGKLEMYDLENYNIKRSCLVNNKP